VSDDAPDKPVGAAAAEKPKIVSPQAAAPLSPPVPAHPPPAADTVAPVTLTFEIRGYRIEGNTLLDAARIERTLALFTGQKRDFGDVQRALEAFQNLYQDAGYAAVQVMLPEQELDKGIVRFNVLETKIGNITVEDNKHFSEANIKRSVPGLIAGRTPNSKEISTSLRLANENPAKQTAVVLRGSEEEGKVDAVLRVADVVPLKMSMSMDNTGNSNTGMYRVGVAMQHANLFDRDHVLTAQYLTSPENLSRVTVVGLGYRIPFYRRGDSLDIVAGYSDVDSGTVQDLFTVTGQGTIFALRYNLALPRWGDVEHKLIAGLDHRSYQNTVLPVTGGFNLVPDITIHPLTLTYQGGLRDARSELNFFVSGSLNLSGGNDANSGDFQNARADARGTYRIVRFGGGYSRAFASEWQARLAFNMQWSPDALVAGEQFGLGGAESIRGFNERYVSNDKGYRTSFEVYTPELSKRFGWEKLRLRFLTFYDAGHIGRNSPFPGELRRSSLDSAGLGLRMNYGTDLSLRLDYAQVMHDGTQTNTPDGREFANRWHASFGWVF